MGSWAHGVSPTQKAAAAPAIGAIPRTYTISGPTGTQTRYAGPGQQGPVHQESPLKKCPTPSRLNTQTGLRKW